MEDTVNLLSDKAKNNLPITKMDKLNKLDKNFNKTLQTRKLYKDDNEVNKQLIKLLTKKAQYDIKMGNKERGLKNLKKLSKFIKDPEMKKDPSTVEKFLRSMLPEKYRYWTPEDVKNNIKNGIDFHKELGKVVLDLPDQDPVLAGLNALTYHGEKFSTKVASKLLSKAHNFKTLMRAVDYLDPISLKQLGSSYPMIFTALGAKRTNQFFKKVKNRINSLGDKLADLASKPKEDDLSPYYPKESYIRKYKLKPKIYAEATKDLLKNKDQLGTFDNMTLNNLDSDYRNLLKTRKNDKYLGKAYDSTHQDDISEFLKRKKQTNREIGDALIQKAIYDIKYGNETRGLKNLNKILDLKLKGKSDFGNNLELLNNYLNKVPLKLDSLHTSKNDKEVLKMKNAKINKAIWSKKKPIVSKLVAKLKDYFNSKEPAISMSESACESLIETTFKTVKNKYRYLDESSILKLTDKVLKDWIKQLP